MDTAAPLLNRQELLRQLSTLKTQCDHEAVERMRIQQGKDYQAADADAQDTERAIMELQQELTAIRQRQQEMFEVVHDSRGELDETKKALISLMLLEGVEGYTEDWISVSGKFSEKKSVNGRRLLEVLQGDIDEFLRVVAPTQKAVKEYAAEHEGLKRELLKCIRLESRELVDVEISIPEA